jgi:hypothetical protein
MKYNVLKSINLIRVGTDMSCKPVEVHPNDSLIVIDGHVYVEGVDENEYICHIKVSNVDSRFVAVNPDFFAQV